MPLGLNRLKRLQRIRKLTAAQDELELALAASALRQAEEALLAQARWAAESRSQAKGALADGERGAWLLAEASCEVAGWSVTRLQALCAERRNLLQPVRERYLLSHREEEQMGLLVEAGEAEARQEDGRTDQREADDWFSRSMPSGRRVSD